MTNLCSIHNWDHSIRFLKNTIYGKVVKYSGTDKAFREPDPEICTGLRKLESEQIELKGKFT